MLAIAVSSSPSKADIVARPNTATCKIVKPVNFITICF